MLSSLYFWSGRSQWLVLQMESAKLLHFSGVQQNMTLSNSAGHYAQPQPAKPFHRQKNIIGISKSVPTGFKM